jgi:hypothetical protein
MQGKLPDSTEESGKKSDAIFFTATRPTANTGHVEARMVESILFFLALELFAFVGFLWGLAGLIIGYYRRGDQILRGNEARMASLKVILISLAMFFLIGIVGSLLLRN